MFWLLTASDVSTAVSMPVSTVDPMIGSLVVFGAFTVTVVIFAAFLSIVRKNKNQMR